MRCPLPKKMFALTWPTSGCRSIGIVRSRTRAMELYIIWLSVMYQTIISSLVHLIPKSLKRPRSYYLLRSATEHCSTYVFTQFAECTGTYTGK
jgi:hypothetical protein